ncbi:MAG: hypothetical protein E5299_00883 [Burkholderia gladioli]|nr:MAG: hypothetical protein E5299_00883 [Burkholderia gladioli]
MTFTRNGRGVYAQRSRGQLPIKSDSRVICLIFAKKMRKDIHKKGEPKARYRVRNWTAYNEGLINRGNVTIGVVA